MEVIAQIQSAINPEVEAWEFIKWGLIAAVGGLAGALKWLFGKVEALKEKITENEKAIAVNTANDKTLENSVKEMKKRLDQIYDMVYELKLELAKKK